MARHTEIVSALLPRRKSAQERRRLLGPDLVTMIGAGAAVQRGVGPQAPYQGAPALCIISDAGAASSLFELDTAAQRKIQVRDPGPGIAVLAH